MRLLRIDIDSWGSAVARQHGIRSIPQLWLYDGKELVTQDTRAALNALQAGP